MAKFEKFLLKEDKDNLGNRIGDVANAAQELQDDMANMGTRHLSRMADEVVNQIRKVLHGDWKDKHHKHLEELQKIAVHVKKTIEEKGDLKEVLPSVTHALGELSAKLSGKTNDMITPEQEAEAGEPVSQDDFQETPPEAPPQQPGMEQQGGQVDPGMDQMGLNQPPMG